MPGTAFPPFLVATWRSVRPFVFQAVFLFLLQQFNRLLWFLGNVFWLQPLGIGEYLQAFWVGAYFDLPVMAYVFAPLWIWWAIAPSSVHRRNYAFRGVATLLAFFTMLLNVIDAAYSNVTSKRSGKELIDVVMDPANSISGYLLDYWWGLILLIISALLIWRWFPMPEKTEGRSVKGDLIHDLPGSGNHSTPHGNLPSKIRGALLISARLLTVGLIILLAGRGGSRLRPLQASDASEFVLPEIAPLVVSTPFNLFSSFQTNGLKSVNWCSTQQIDSQFLGTTKPFSQVHLSHAPMNLVVIVVESLARDYTGFLNGAPYTPFLDKLSKNPDAVVLPYCFANGTKSIEMAPSLFAGLPSLMEDFFITSNYSTNRFTNAFGYFNRWGYQTSFFHGSNNGTMGFQSFLKSGGLQRYSGIDEYPQSDSDFDGHWGIFDEPYLQQYCKELSAMKAPFFSSVFTLSSHHPYTLPKNLPVHLPGSEKTVQKTIAYADFALQRFFESAQKQPWFSNTLFLITGDHTSHGTLEYFYSPSGHYEIPALFYAPGKQSKINSLFNQKTVLKTCSQLDLIPSAVAFISGETDVRLGQGRSVLDTAYNGYSYHFDKGLYYIIQYPYVLVMNQEGDCLDFYKQIRNSNRKESCITSNELKIIDQKYRMQLHLKMAVQSYRNALINNQWDQQFNR